MKTKHRIISIDESIVWVCRLAGTNDTFIRFSNGRWYSFTDFGYWAEAPEDMYLELRFEEAMKERPF